MHKRPVQDRDSHKGLGSRKNSRSMEVLDYEKSSRNERSTLTISPVSRRPKKLKLVSPKMKKLMEKKEISKRSKDGRLSSISISQPVRSSSLSKSPSQK